MKTNQKLKLIKWILDEIGTVQDEDGSNGQSNGLSDLQNLSQLTELARLRMWTLILAMMRTKTNLII